MTRDRDDTEEEGDEPDVGPTPDRAKAYVPPRRVPAASHYRTYEIDTVTIAAELKKSHRAPTIRLDRLQLAALAAAKRPPKRRARGVLFFLGGLMLLLAVGGVLWGVLYHAGLPMGLSVAVSSASEPVGAGVFSLSPAPPPQSSWGPSRTRGPAGPIATPKDPRSDAPEVSQVLEFGPEDDLQEPGLPALPAGSSTAGSRSLDSAGKLQSLPPRVVPEPDAPPETAVPVPEERRGSKGSAPDTALWL